MKSSESNLERMSSIGFCTGLAKALGMDYKAEESRLFLDSSVRSMKAVPLLIGNTVLRFPLLIQTPNASFFIFVSPSQVFLACFATTVRCKRLT